MGRVRFYCRRSGVSSKTPILTISALILVAALPAFSRESDRFAAARAQMVREIEADVRYTASEIGKKALNRKVMQAMATVERHQFVPASLQNDAYDNRPLPIGFGQTISQPYIVALMTDLLDVKPSDVVFEVGTGSAYQAAILSKLVRKVYTMEIVAPLAKAAAARVRRLGLSNVEVRSGDGYNGWPEKGPFDAIIVTAAATHIPPPLVRQLKPGGRMVIPVGGGFATQQLVFVQKSASGKITTRQLLPVVFVPLTRK